MKKLPVRRVVLPSDLRGVPNGDVPARLLKPIEPSGRLHWRAARSYAYLRALAAQERLVLGQVGDYRPLAQQVALFEARMRTFPDAKRQKQVTRTWNGVTYYLHSGGAVASPGTSNHGLGLALDFCLILPNGTKTTITAKPARAKRSGLEFLLANADKAGFSWELQSEPWHLRFVAGDRKLPAVESFVAG